MRVRWATGAVTALVVAVAFTVYLTNRSTTPSTSSTSTAPSSTSTTLLDPATEQAVWPSAASAVRYTTPLAAAIGFAVDLVHMTNPIAEPFRRGDARSGEVPVRSSAIGPVTTVLVRQLTSDGSWWVLGSSTPDIVISPPDPMGLVGSPLTIRGHSTAFEAVVNVALHQDDVATPLVATTFMGGSMGQMGPFHKTMTFAPATSRRGALVLYTVSAKDGTVANASVIRVAFH